MSRARLREKPTAAQRPDDADGGDGVGVAARDLERQKPARRVAHQPHGTAVEGLPERRGVGVNQPRAAEKLGQRLRREVPWMVAGQGQGDGVVPCKECGHALCAPNGV